MPVQSTSGPPKQFDAGVTVIFTDTFSLYPTSGWTMKFILNNGVAAPTTTNATISGTLFTVTLAATTTASLAPGKWQWSEIVTETSTTQVAVANQGKLDILPDLLLTATPSFWQAQVTLLQTALAALGATTKQSVSINGQSFSRASIQQYRDQLAYAEQRASLEEYQRDGLRGEKDTKQVNIRFAPGGFGIFPFRRRC